MILAAFFLSLSVCICIHSAQCTVHSATYSRIHFCGWHDKKAQHSNKSAEKKSALIIRIEHVKDSIYGWKWKRRRRSERNSRNETRKNSVNAMKTIPNTEHTPKCICLCFAMFQFRWEYLICGEVTGTTPHEIFPHFIYLFMITSCFVISLLLAIISQRYFVRIAVIMSIYIFRIFLFFAPSLRHNGMLEQSKNKNWYIIPFGTCTLIFRFCKCACHGGQIWNSWW